MPAVGGGHPGDPAVRGVDPLHRRVEPDLAAEFVEELDQRRDQRSGAALDEEDPPVAFEIVDEGVDRRRGVGVAADEQRVEAEDLPQLIVLDELGDDGVDAAVALEPDELRRDLDHAPEVEERGRRELGVALVEDLLGVGEELHVAVDVAGALVGDLLRGRLEVVGVVEGVAVLPVEAIEGHHRQQGDVVRHVAAGGGEDLFEARRRGDDGRPAVEGVALVLGDIGPPARLVAFLDDGGLDPGRLEAHRQGEPAETAADHCRCWLFHRCPPLGSMVDLPAALRRSDEAPHCTSNGHRRLSGQHSDLVGPFQPAGVEAPDERIRQAVEALEDPVALIGLGGAEEHPVEQPVVAGAPPVIHRPLPGQLKQRRTVEFAVRSDDIRQRDRIRQRVARGGLEEGAPHPASGDTGWSGFPVRIDVAAVDDGQNPGFLTRDFGDRPPLGGRVALESRGGALPGRSGGRCCSRCLRSEGRGRRTAGCRRIGSRRVARRWRP